jgi:hypothetical protein
MKTYKNLYPQIYSFENLYRSFRAARKGKRDETVGGEVLVDLWVEAQPGRARQLVARFWLTRGLKPNRGGRDSW